MKRYLNWLFYNQPTLYKGFLFFLISGAILYMFPKGGKFQYEYQKGLPWKHAALYAPFDFPVLKTTEELENELKAIEKEVNNYYRLDTLQTNLGLELYDKNFDTFFAILSPDEKERIQSQGKSFLTNLYQQGVVPIGMDSTNEFVLVVDGNTERQRTLSSFFQIESLTEQLPLRLPKEMVVYQKNFNDLFFEILTPNLVQDTLVRNQIFTAFKESISPTKGIVTKGSLVIAENEMVVGERYQRLQSLVAEYQSSSWTGRKEFMNAVGYALLIGLALFMIMRFLFIYRQPLFENNKELTFVFFNVFLMVILTISILSFDPNLIYGVPLCILPLTIKAFFDERIGFVIHVLTILLLGFVVPNSFEFVFLQVLAGIATIQSSTKLYQRANLFISVGQIVLIYILVYVCFTLIHEGSIDTIEFTTLALFLLNGLLTLFVQPLIYLFEKLFAMTSDISLLELSDTNTPLLKALSDQAPGTFHHSLQVANLAEAAASQIGANTLLIRVGALYHDIGKMKNPTYFSENQKSDTSPHYDLNPQQSASIILNHVLEGITIAKKYNLPERIIDFIRTHHGTSLVYYFYKQEQELNPEQVIDAKLFKYQGPKPFSKETAILMMADAVEAASKSLRDPNVSRIEAFVEQIVQKQLDEGQFNTSNITLAEIEQVKKVLIRKLSNIYHLRIEYPE